MIDRVEVAEDPDRTEHRTEKQKGKLAAVDGNVLSGADILYQKDQSEKRRDQIPEKALLDARKITGQPDTAAHQGKTESGEDDADNAFGALIHGKSSFQENFAGIIKSVRLSFTLSPFSHSFKRQAENA